MKSKASRYILIVQSLSVALVLAACGLSVHRSNPRPNIAMDESDTALALVLADEIMEEYKIPPRQGVTTTKVKGWRETLAVGFTNGLGRYFRAPGGDNAALTLEISEAEFALIPAVVASNGAVTAVTGQIRYQAKLIGSNGEVLRRSARTVKGKAVATKPEGMTLVGESAVETMYEVIAHDFFSEL